MDPRAFDALARSLAAPQTRRGLLGSLAALGAGLIAGRVTAAQTVTQTSCGNVTCKNNPGKCREGCVCCVWSNGNNRCVPPGGCGNGGAVTCPPGQISNGAGGCAATTTTSTTTTTTTTTTPVPSPTDVVNGGAFEICNNTYVCSGGATNANCYCGGGASGSGNYLCVAPTAATCTSNADCPSGRVCIGSNQGRICAVPC